MEGNRFLRRILDALPSLSGLGVLAWLLLEGSDAPEVGLTATVMTALAAAVAAGVLVRIFGPQRGARPVRDALRIPAEAAAIYSELLTSRPPGSPPGLADAVEQPTPSGLPEGTGADGPRP